MARWAVAAEPRSPGRSGGWPGGGAKSPALALVMASLQVRAPCVTCANTSPTVHPAHALGLDHSSGRRPAKKSWSWDASALINSTTSVIAIVLISLHWGRWTGRAASCLALLTGWPVPKHDITGEFHMPMVLRQFFVTLEHKAPLRPGPVRLAHRRREGAGLITTDAGEVVWEVLLHLAHRLPDLRDCPMGTEFSVTVTVLLAPSQGSTDKISR